MKFKTTLIVIGVLISNAVDAQVDSTYIQALHNINTHIANPSSESFKQCVYEVENAYLDGDLNLDAYNKSIDLLVNLVVQTKANSTLEKKYKPNYSDFKKIQNGAAIFRVMRDTIPVIVGSDTLSHLPYRYDFEDVFGDEDWTKMFVSKLLMTRTGNCHSLPYLFKILANELDFDVRLALAPNHVYIKTHSQQYGWFNIELTSGTFPMDAWLMASSYVSIDAIRNGIFMVALEEKESIALCLIDLAKGYARRYPENDGSFVFQCTELALKHYPRCIEAMLIQAELKKKHLKVKALDFGLSDIMETNTHPKLKAQYKEMQEAYSKVYNLGYRQMPKQMYINWLMTVDEEKSKFENQEIREKH